ncbi:hypothetical protein ACFWY5_55860 [Nonomuraea sp. NPDC059007]|uniref:hypothetical protein n=1 Tax=Nonomuraea sp. NPDC059007 TaxID=3346692 RepID=UPI0036BCF1FE
MTSLHLGAADTDMMVRYDGDKSAPEAVVAAALDGIEAHRPEALAGAWSPPGEGAAVRGPGRHPEAALST